MEQRLVRLGDVLDDYCPRDRRVTNHVVVALVGDDIKLTRCTTCETEHAYKAAQVPPRRQTKLVAALSSSEGAATPAPQGSGKAEEMPSEVIATSGSSSSTSVESIPPLRVDSVRRTLIRATLGRADGAPAPARVAPVFTIRENSGREGGYEHGGKPSRKRRPGSRSGGEANGNRAEGYQGQSPRPSQGKNGSRPPRANSTTDRSDRPNNNQSRNRGKGRTR
jgi:hypothetical protein